MKTRFIAAVTEIARDRTVLVLIASTLILSLLYVIYVLLSLRPGELQVAIHYSAFGDTHYYRAGWQYLISFAIFGIIFAAGHVALMAKLVKNNLRDLAIAFGWLSLLLLVVTFLYTRSVLGVAFLS